MSKSIWYYFYKVVISCERIYLTSESALFSHLDFPELLFPLDLHIPALLPSIRVDNQRDVTRRQCDWEIQHVFWLKFSSATTLRTRQT